MMQNSNPKTRGGRRPGAGRKHIYNEGAHAARPTINCKRPLHITLRLRAGLANLRNREILKHIRKSILRAQEFGLRINQYSILKNHIHLLVEVDDPVHLQRGMMSFNGRLGRLLRRQPGFDAKKYPRGLFTSRYHQKVIRNARQMKNTLAYVLLNASKHFKRVAYIDEYSSGFSFRGWRELLGPRFDGLIMAQVLSMEELGQPKREVTAPKTWLGRKGWRVL